MKYKAKYNEKANKWICAECGKEHDLLTNYTGTINVLHTEDRSLEDKMRLLYFGEPAITPPAGLCIVDVGWGKLAAQGERRQKQCDFKGC